MGVFMQSRILLALIFMSWIAWSFTQVIYSTGSTPETRITRGELFAYLLLPTSSDHPVVAFAKSWEVGAIGDWMAERGPIFFWALALWGTFLAVGHLFLRTFGYRPLATRGEWWAISWGLGGAIVSLMVQGLGLLGMMNRWVFLSIGLASIALMFASLRGCRFITLPTAKGFMFGCLLVMPMVALTFLSAMLPTPDYDAHAYHLLGPKEWFLAGRIHFLPHNVYTTFPFLTEMFSLLGMILTSDPWKGGLVGQVTLAGYGPMTAWMIYLIGRRLYSPEAGMWAGVIYATTPWMYRLSSIPYVEGAMLFFLSAGLWGLLVDPRGTARSSMIVGMMAGAAFGCKYPALAMVALPLWIGTLATSRASWLRQSCFFLMGFTLLSGWWLGRNYLWTGNPIFPLLDPLFGSHHWSEDRYEGFRRSHQSADFGLLSMGSFLQDVLVRSDWQSALAFVGLPLAWILGRGRVTIAILLLIAFQYLVFYFGTHRLDRFFLAVEPLGIILSGGVVAVLMTLGLRWILWPAIIAVILFNTLFCLTPLAGMNLYARPIAEVREISVQAVSSTLAELRASRGVPSDSTILYVGLAAVYESPSRAIYNTVFDESRLLSLIAEKSAGEYRLREAKEIHERLEQAGVDYVLVDWTWIERYREPGNYGFPEFVTKDIFDTLVRERVLRPIKVDSAWDLYQLVKERPSS
jgi:4-amino-4-deoxy-L-arabinose transferase-like glycosyltransferase